MLFVAELFFIFIVLLLEMIAELKFLLYLLADL